MWSSPDVLLAFKLIARQLRNQVFHAGYSPDPKRCRYSTLKRPQLRVCDGACTWIHLWSLAQVHQCHHISGSRRHLCSAPNLYVMPKIQQHGIPWLSGSIACHLSWRNYCWDQRWDCPPWRPPNYVHSCGGWSHQIGHQLVSIKRFSQVTISASTKCRNLIINAAVAGDNKNGHG